VILDKIERWLAIAETCSDKRMESVVAEMRDVVEDLKTPRFNIMNTTWAYSKSGLVAGLDKPCKMRVTWKDGSVTEEVMHPAGIHSNYGFIVGTAVRL